MATRKGEFSREVSYPTDQPSPYLYLPDGTLHQVDIQGHETLRAGQPFPMRQREKRTSRAGGKLGDQSVGVPTDFLLLPDGTLVDLIEDRNHPQRMRFVRWNNQSATVLDQIEFGGQLLTPPTIHRSLIGAVRLPTGIAPCGEPHTMLERIEATISCFVDLSADSLRLASAYVLYTWLQDRFEVAPYLWLVGPLESGKTTLLKLVSCLCRRAVVVGDITAAGLYLLQNALKGTLIIDEADFGNTRASRDLQRVLRTGSTRGFCAVRNGQLFETFGAKVIALRQPPQDTALASRGIVIPMRPSQRDLPPLDMASMQAVAEEFQRQLLWFRLENYARIKSRQILEMELFAPRTRDLARALVAPFLGHPDLERSIVETLEKQDHEARLDRYLEPEWIVLRALFHLCHQRITGGLLVRVSGGLLVGEVTGRANDLLSEYGEIGRLTARRVGAILKSLGIRTAWLGSRGRGMKMTLRFIRKIHELTRDYGVSPGDFLDWRTNSAGHAGLSCAYCARYGLVAVDPYTKLPLCDSPPLPSSGSRNRPPMFASADYDGLRQGGRRDRTRAV